MEFKFAYNEYLKYIENRQKIQSKNSIIDRFKNTILPFFGNMNIHEISKVDYINFQNQLIKKEYSKNYIKNTHYYIVAFLNYCIQFYNLEKNIAREVGIPKLLDKDFNKKKFYTLKEFKCFIKFVDDRVYRLFFEFMFLTGCRPGEAMALKFSDISGINVSINKTIDEHCHNGIRNITNPKTKTSNRIIKLPHKLVVELKKLYNYYIKKYGVVQDFYIFGGIKPLAPTTINRYKIKACKLANIEPITLHGFRHSHATLLLDSKISIKAIQQRLGHSDSNTTISIYLHSTEKQQKRVLRKLNFVLLFSTF